MAVTKADVLAIVNSKAGGFVLEIHPDYLWQDTTKTTPVTAADQVVQYIEDQSVHGFDFSREFALGASSPSLQQDANGKYYILNANSGTSPTMFRAVGADQTNVGAVIAGQPYMVAAAINPNNQADQYFFGTVVPSSSLDNDNVVHLGMRGTGTFTVAHWYNDANFSHSVTVSGVTKVHTAKYLSPGSKYFVDGVEEGTNATTPSTLGDTSMGMSIYGRQPIAGSSGSAEYFYGRAYAFVAILGDSVTAQEQADIEEWLGIQAGTITPAITGTGAVTAQAASVSASGSVTTTSATITGSAAATAQAASVSASGSVSAPSQTHTGSGAATASAAEGRGYGTVSTPGVSTILHVGTAHAISTADTTDVALPAGAQEGDLAIAYACQDSIDPLAVPAGFTTVYDSGFGTSGSDSTMVVGYKVLGASEPSTLTFTTDATEDKVCAISVFRAVDTATPPTVGSQEGDSLTPTAPSLGSTKIGNALVAIVGVEDGAASPFTPPAGMTELLDEAHGSGPASAGLTLAWETLTATGATGTRTFTASNEDTWAAVSLVLSAVTFVSGAGYARAGTASTSATGEVISGPSGTATVVAQPATTSGTGSRGVQGTATATAQPATTSASGFFTLPMAGSATARATAAGSQGAKRATTGAATATASTQAWAFARLPFTGGASATAVGTGHQALVRSVSGAATARATATGSLSQSVSGSAVARATAQGALWRRAHPQSTVTARATASAGLGIKVPMAGSATARATGGAELLTSLPLSGSATARATSQGATLRSARPTLAATAGATATATLHKRVRPSAQVTARATGQGDARRSARPTLTATARATATAQLNRAQFLAGSATARAVTQAELDTSTLRRMRGSATARAKATGRVGRLALPLLQATGVARAKGYLRIRTSATDTRRLLAVSAEDRALLLQPEPRELRLTSTSRRLDVL